MINYSDIIVFSGLTLKEREVQEHLPSCVYLPPAIQGDLYKAYKAHKPKIIVLIDGLFEVEPSVWHKEILYILSQNVAVYGSSSIGALRAAELEPFGMQGVGNIFNGYLSGALEDDDEVAVFYGPKEIDYPALSDAMVSIRATIAKACNNGILNNDTSLDIIKIAKNLFYKDRTYERVFSLLDWENHKIDNLKNWVAREKIDLKHSDAVELMQKLANLDTISMFEPLFNFNETIFWEHSKT